MSLTAFALVASEFMPVSLLTPISTDLSVTEGQAGQTISVAAICALLTSLFISSVAGSVDRKKILLGLASMLLLSGLIVGFAPSYAVLLVGRVFIGIAVGGFWSMSAATVIRLVKPNHVPRALAVVNGGNALATVVAAPLGSFLGGAIGWRGAFLCFAPIAGVACVWLATSLPRLPAIVRPDAASALGLMKQRRIALGMLAVSAFFMGQFSLFTYLRPFLETVTLVSGTTLSLMLLVIGVAGFIGTCVIGLFLKEGLYRTLIVIPMIMCVVAVLLLTVGSFTVVTVVLLAVWGLVATAAPVGWWTWVAQSMPDDAEAGGGLMVAIVQFAIAFGAVLGGALFDMSGYQATFGLSAALLVLSAVLSYLAARAAKTLPLPSVA